MEPNENKYSFFDEELRKKADESKVNYKAVEAVLFSRITEVEHLDELAALKLDEMPLSDVFDKVENRLFSQIAQHNEYDIPMDECIRAQYDLSQAQWDRLESKIEERIHNSETLPNWELFVMASEDDPLLGEWEVIEDGLSERIGVVSGQEPWEQAARLDEMQIQDSLDTVEKMLDNRIMEKADLEDWEMVLKQEKIIPYSSWEKIEEQVFDKIENDSEGRKPLTLEEQPFWNIINSYVLTMKTVRATSAALLLLLIVVGGYYAQQSLSSQVPTLVYQLQGSAAELAETYNKAENKEFGSVKGGSVSLVNLHGLVEIQNGSDVKVDKLTKKDAWYKVGFNSSGAKGGVASGQVAFLVNPHHGKETFRVQTPDYQIIVKGTYFKVEPDLGGRMVTRVLEGEVKVESEMFGGTSVKAGESLVYDLFTGEYKVQGGGAVVQRKDLEVVPDVDDLRNYKSLTIRSAVENADIRIDGRYYGAAPLTIRQPAGKHQLWIGKSGFYAVDTTIVLGDNDRAVDIVLTPVQLSEPVVENGNNNKVTELQKIVKNTAVVSMESVATTLLGTPQEPRSSASLVDSLYGLAQAVEAMGDWKDALDMYQQIFDNPDASRLRKEDALFSIGKLRANNEANKTEARQVFLTYLAMFPGGFFAGETWLRLAELEFKTNPENAVQYYLKYFEMFPKHPRISELQNRVGVIYLQQKKYDEAISLFRQALSSMISQSKTERANVTSNLYRALEAKGDSKSADSVQRLYNLNYSEEK